MIFTSSSKTFVCLTLLASRLALSDFAILAADACADVDSSKWNYSRAERSKLRVKSSTPISLNYEHTRQFLQNNDYNALIRGTLTHFSIIICLIAFCAISFIVYLVYCSCLRKRNSPLIHTNKFIKVFTIICFVGFLGFFGAAIAFTAKIKTNFNDLDCIFYKVPAEIMQGVAGTSSDYIGLRSLSVLLSSFTSEVETLDTLKDTFDNIKGLNLKGNANSPIRALTDFYNKNRNQTTFDGEGNKAKPISVLNLTTGVSPEIYEEFTAYNQLAVAVHAGNDIGISIGQNNMESVYLGIAKQARESLDSTLISLDGEFLTISNNMSTTLNYSIIASFFGLSNGLVIFVLGSCLIIAVLWAPSQQICVTKKGLIRTLLPFLSFLTLCFATLSVLLFIVATAVSSYCEFQADMLEATDVAFFLNQYKLDIRPEMLGLISRCATATSNKSISDLLGFESSNKKQMDNIQSLYNGFISYGKMHQKIASNGLDSTAILDQVALWETYTNGFNIDHQNIKTTLAELLKLTNCGPVEYALNAARCSDATKRCEIISKVADFVAPGCSNDSSRAKYLFSVLKAYLEDEKEVLSTMSTNLSNRDTDTANKRFRNLKNLLSQANPLITTIKATFTQSFAITEPYVSNFNDLVSCSKVREELEDLEAVVCFNSNRNIYLLFIMILCSTCLLFIMNWFICLLATDAPETVCDASQETGDVNKSECGAENSIVMGTKIDN